jgi:hypothetical protein
LAQISERAQQIDTTDQFSRFVESLMAEADKNNSGGDNGEMRTMEMGTTGTGGPPSLEQCFI